MLLKDAITVVIPTSPIPSCPSTTLIEQTILSVRRHLPDCRILIQMDGIRPEQEKFRQAYLEYKVQLRLRVLMNREWGNVGCFECSEFNHQASMMKKTLAYGLVTTPLLFYLEHDLPLLPEPIDWENLVAVLLSGQVNQVRLHYWSQILPDHAHLMLDEQPWKESPAVPLIRTIQWSQHPHLARVDFYRRLLDSFSDESRTMIETKVYGMVSSALWEEYRCAIYAPFPNLRRVWHTHGREEEPKFEETFVF